VKPNGGGRVKGTGGGLEGNAKKGVAVHTTRHLKKREIDTGTRMAIIPLAPVPDLGKRKKRKRVRLKEL